MLLSPSSFLSLKLINASSDEDWQRKDPPLRIVLRIVNMCKALGTLCDMKEVLVADEQRSFESRTQRTWRNSGMVDKEAASRRQTGWRGCCGWALPTVSGAGGCWGVRGDVAFYFLFYRFKNI